MAYSIAISLLTLSPSVIGFHDFVPVRHILEPLLLQLVDLVRAATLVRTKQRQLKHRRAGKLL